MKLPKVKLPTGQDVNLSQFPMLVGGVIVLIFAVATGQAIARRLAPFTNAVPGGILDGSIEPLVNSPQKSTGRAKVIV